jgi:plasmid maintenance system antidote protein VapI
MSNFLLQLQLLLAALSALLLLLPNTLRTRASEILDVAGKALSLGGTLSVSAEDLARRLAVIRAEIEAMATARHMVTADELDAAMARVSAASSAFREALQTAEAGPN